MDYFSFTRTFYRRHQEVAAREMTFVMQGHPYFLAGTAYVQVDGKANEGVLLNFAGGVRFASGCFMDTDANISYATIGCTRDAD